MKYEVRLQVIPDDPGVEIIPAFYLLDAEHFDKIAASCQAHALPPENPVTETPVPVFQPEPTVTELPEADVVQETATESTNDD